MERTGRAALRPRLLYVVTEDWYFVSHRLSLARAAMAAGFDVAVATRAGAAASRIEAAGVRVIPIRMRRSGAGLWGEIRSIIELASLYRRERPLLVHHVALKPVVFGAIAATLARVPFVVNAVAGLGHIFVAKGAYARVRRTLLGFALRRALGGRRSRTIFQNPEDREALVRAGVRKERTVLIRGVGVDLDRFHPSPAPDGAPVVLLAGRLLWSKGVGELVEASRRLRACGLRFRTVLAGEPDFDNPQAIPLETIRSWQDAGEVEWWGRRDDMDAVLSEASVVVLPTTYGEGVPKVLLEAAASGRPIVATDVPGCREVVRDGENGYLVPPGDVDALADRIERLLGDAPLRKRLGQAARRIAEEEFSEALANASTIDVYRELCSAERLGASVEEGPPEEKELAAVKTNA
ncbi:MAG TPA: glycosyltransferase family 4 protein [Planctomycetota bacterium]|nr:glycosyltransferase family 4 protein [Planctomycetota bacterium]